MDTDMEDSVSTASMVSMEDMDATDIMDITETMADMSRIVIAEIAAARLTAVKPAILTAATMMKTVNYEVDL